MRVLQIFQHGFDSSLPCAIISKVLFSVWTWDEKVQASLHRERKPPTESFLTSYLYEGPPEKLKRFVPVTNNKVFRRVGGEPKWNHGKMSVFGYWLSPMF